ncbi:hypothetical protein [Streptomyces sp. NPDC013187]|uniref:hypothetical protein n=1 Tax=Streptomyces sp. NPDC013187 TaxID=3364865 RepID=UPI00369E0B17
MQDPHERAELTRLLDKDVDELLVLLALSDPDHAETMFSAEEARNEGRRRFQQLTPLLHQRICTEWRYCEKKANGAFNDNIEVAVAVADLITTVVGGLPVSVVTALIVKRGLNRLCGCAGAG